MKFCKIRVLQGLHDVHFLTLSNMNYLFTYVVFRFDTISLQVLNHEKGLFCLFTEGKPILCFVNIQKR